MDFHWNSSNLIYLNEFQSDSLNQKWLLIENEIVSKGVQSQADQSRCFDVFYGSVDDGAIVGVYSRHRGLHQLWNITCIENCGGNQTNTSATVATRDCVFPFKYRNQTYNACTTADYGRFWCGMEENDVTGTGKWVWCDSKDSTNGWRACKFPFQYKDVSHYQCTALDHNRPWCYFEQKAGAWGNC